MAQLFMEGGPVFMGILTLVLLVVGVLTVIGFQKAMTFSGGDFSSIAQSISSIKSVGLFGLIVGIFGQLLGLYEAMKFIAQNESVSPQMLAGGIKVSMISSLYGCLIFMLAYLFAFAAEAYAAKKVQKG